MHKAAVRIRRRVPRAGTEVDAFNPTLPAPSAAEVGVVAVVAGDVEPGRWDVHEQAGEQLLGVQGLASPLRGRLVSIAGTSGLEGEAIERQGRR